MELCKKYYQEKTIKPIKEQLKKINFRNYIINQIVPGFNELHYGFSVLRKDYIEFINTTEEKCTTILKLDYSSIKEVYIDSIIIQITLNDGTVYYMKELRTDLKEILGDFKSESINIMDKQDLYILINYEIIEDIRGNIIMIGNLVNENNIVQENEFKYNINLDDIQNMDENYDADDDYRDIIIKTRDNDILIWKE